jgi:hypothetical protein
MKKIFALSVLVILLAACGGNKDNRPMNEYLSAFLKDNKTVVAFGAIDVQTILKKSDYSTIPKFGLLVKKEIEGLEGSINVNAPIYFALEGPFAEDGTPETTYAFMEVKSADSLEANLVKRGFDIEKDGDEFYHASGDVAFGFRNNLLILITKKGEFDGKKLAAEAFDKVGGDVSGGKVDQIFSAKGDFILGANIENLYGTSNTDLKDLSDEKQAALKKLVADCYVQSTLKLESGQAVLETKNLFSSEMSKRMFFNSDSNAGVVSYLGTGNPRIGFATNFDVKKMQGFLDEFSPNTMNELAETIGGPAQLALMAGGEEALAGLFNGKIGVVMVGEPIPGGSMTPDLNFYVGVHKNGKSLAENFKGFLDAGMAKVVLDDNGLAAYTSAKYVPVAGQKLNIPAGCEGFGKKGLTAFVNFDGLDMKQFSFEGEQKLIYLIKYATYEMDNSGSTLILKAKDKDANVMKQVVDVLVKELADKIKGMNI